MITAISATLALLGALAPSNQVGTTFSSTTSLHVLIDELNGVMAILSSSTSSSGAHMDLSAEGREMLTEPSTSSTAVVPPPMASASAGARVRLVYTGASSGLGAERYTFQLPTSLADVLGKRGRVVSITPIHGVLSQGVSLLVAPDGLASTLVRFFSGGEIECGLPEEVWSVRTPTERLLVRIGEEWLPDSRLPRWLMDVAPLGTRREYEVRTCENEAGVRTMLYSPARASFQPPVWRLSDFEFRRGLHLELSEDGLARSVEIVGLPANDPARRFRLLAAATQSRDHLLYVDAGSFVDGGSRFDTDALSSLRPLAFEMLARLQPAALVPGNTELIPGAARLAREARAAGLTYVATNWKAESTAFKLPPAILREIKTDGAPVRIAFLGVVDPQLASVSAKLKTDGVSLDEPVAAVTKAIGALRSSAQPPDIVVVLTTAPPPLLEALRARLRGVDILIGDAGATGQTLRRTHLDFTPDTRWDRPVAAVLPLDNIGVADLGLVRRNHRWRLGTIDLSLLRTSEHLKPDARVEGEVTRARAQPYPSLERPLLAQPKDGPLETLSQKSWVRVVCEAVRRKTGADVVMLPDLPPPDPAPGPQTGIMIADRLAVLDELVSDELVGDDLGPLLAEPPPYLPTICGAQVGTNSPQILGRDLAGDRVYRIVTTDRALGLGFAAKLKSAHSGRLLDRAGADPILTEHGEPLSLRHAVLSYLGTTATASPMHLAPLEPLLVDSAERKQPAWILAFDQLALALERTRGANDPAFSQVPDALANSPSSLAVGFAGDAALLYDSDSLLADLRSRVRYRRLELESAPAQQVEDDLRLSSSGSLPQVAWPIGPLAWMPFLEALFDTEFRHEFDALTGSRLPRRADLSLTLGLSTKSRWIDRLRVGGVALRDLSRPDRSTVWGARSDAQISVDLGRGLRLKTNIEANVFGRTSQDDPRDLLFKIYVESRLEVPLARHVAIAPYARLFTFEGRVPPTEHVRTSYLLGLSFALRGAFPL